MGHNSVVSGHPKSMRIPWVDGLSTGPPDLGSHNRDWPRKEILCHDRACVITTERAVG